MFLTFFLQVIMYAQRYYIIHKTVMHAAGKSGVRQSKQSPQSLKKYPSSFFFLSLHQEMQ